MSENLLNNIKGNISKYYFGHLNNEDNPLLESCKKFEKDIKSTYNELSRDMNNKSKLNDLFLEKIKEMKKRSYNLERQLYEKNNSSGNYDSINKVSYWTSIYGLNSQKIEDKNVEIDDKTCFQLIVGEKTFSSFLDKYLAGNRISLSTLYGENKVPKKEGTKQTDIKKVKNKIENTPFSFKAAIENNNNLKNGTEEELISDFKKRVGGIKTESDKTGRKMMKQSFKEALKKQGMRNGVYYLMIGESGSEKPFITVTLEENQNSEEGQQGEELRNAFLSAIELFNINKNGDNSYDFNELGLGTITITDKNDGKDILSEYKKKAKKYVGQIHFDKITFSKGSESGTIGLVGEVLRYEGFSSFKNIEHLGPVQEVYTNSTGAKTNVGESISDIGFSFEEQKLGVNIKHYVSQDTSVEIYKGNEGVSLFERNIVRYLSSNEIEVFRFIFSNKNILKESMTFDNFSNSLKEKASIHFDGFIREYSILSGRENIFYLINNLVIPSSMIFEKVYNFFSEDNNEISKYFQINNIDFPSKMQTKKEDFPERNLLENIFSSPALKIKFTGLKIQIADYLQRGDINGK